MSKLQGPDFESGPQSKPLRDGLKVPGIPPGRGLRSRCIGSALVQEHPVQIGIVFWPAIPRNKTGMISNIQNLDQINTLPAGSQTGKSRSRKKRGGAGKLNDGLTSIHPPINVCANSKTSFIRSL
jgi:hypothetical protein